MKTQNINNYQRTSFLGSRVIQGSVKTLNEIHARTYAKQIEGLNETHVLNETIEPNFEYTAFPIEGHPYKKAGEVTALFSTGKEYDRFQEFTRKAASSRIAVGEGFKQFYQVNIGHYIKIPAEILDAKVVLEAMKKGLWDFINLKIK